MISLQRSMHSSQMYTPGPAMSFLTCFCDFPQNEHFSRSPPSPMRATEPSPLLSCGPRPIRGPLCWSLPHLRRPDGTSAALRRYPAPALVPNRALTLPRASRDVPTIRAVNPPHVTQTSCGLEDLVDQAVLHGLGGGEDLVALDVWRICSSCLPVCWAIIRSRSARIRRISRAWISMSLDWPSLAAGRAGGSGCARSAARSACPCVPAASSTAAAEAAWPMQMVWMSGRMNFIVS